MDMNGETLHIELVGPTGTALSAIVFLDESEGHQDDFGNDQVRVTLKWAGGEIAATGLDFFLAFCDVREQLESFNLVPRCYGACRNLVLSGMCSDMGQGLSGSLTQLGHKPKMSDLVGIFDAGLDMDLASVAEQREFNRTWLQSVGAAG
jgi:hypothetical protein